MRDRYQLCLLILDDTDGELSRMVVLTVSLHARAMYTLCRPQLGSGDETKDALCICAVAVGEALPSDLAVGHDAAALIHNGCVSASPVRVSTALKSLGKTVSGSFASGNRHAHMIARWMPSKLTHGYQILPSLFTSLHY